MGIYMYFDRLRLCFQALGRADLLAGKPLVSGENEPPWADSYVVLAPGHFERLLQTHAVQYEPYRWAYYCSMRLKIVGQG